MDIEHFSIWICHNLLAQFHPDECLGDLQYFAATNQYADPSTSVVHCYLLFNMGNKRRYPYKLRGRLKMRNSPGQYGSVSWSIILWTERLQVQFMVRAHTHVAGSIPGQGTYEKAPNQYFSLTSMFLFLSLPSYLSKSNEKNPPGKIKTKTKLKMRNKCQESNVLKSGKGPSLSWHLSGQA